MQGNLPRRYRENFPKSVARQDEGAHLLYQLVHWPFPDLR